MDVSLLRVVLHKYTFKEVELAGECCPVPSRSSGVQVVPPWYFKRWSGNVFSPGVLAPSTKRSVFVG